MTEQEFSGVLSLRDLIKDGVNRSAFNHPVQSNAGHDRWCRLLRERVKNYGQTHCGSIAGVITPNAINWDNHGTSLSERTDPVMRYPRLQILFGKRVWVN